MIKPTLRQDTIFTILGVTFGLILWDTFAAWHSESDTISDVLHDAGQKSQFVPFAFGCLMAHLFFGVSDKPQQPSQK